MSKTVLDAIDGSIATLARVVDAPTGALGFGTDVWCTDDADENLSDVDAFSPVGIGQALVHRLTTPTGTLPDDRDYGLDVRGYCNRGVPVDELRDLAGAIRLEITKDDRVDDASVNVTIPEANTLRIAIRITPENPAITPFSMVLAAMPGELTLEILR
jgi:hypothetical protein